MSEAYVPRIIINEQQAISAGVKPSLFVGPQGEKGERGVGIDRIERTDGTGAPGTIDTYTIYLSDGNTATFTVQNGKNGADGMGSGDMMASIYDPDGDGVVDKAASLTGNIEMGQVTGLDIALAGKADDSDIDAVEEALAGKADGTALDAVDQRLTGHIDDKNNPHAVTPGQIGAAQLVINKTITVGASDWTLQTNNVLYLKKVSVSGIESSDTPIIDLVQSGTEVGKDDIMREFWNKVTRITTYAGGISIYATEKPGNSFTIRIMVVR